MKTTRKKAIELLYSLWENGEVPSNFTEDHSDYLDAIEFIIKNNYFNYFDFINR